MNFIIDTEPNLKEINENIYLEIKDKFNQNIELTEEDKTNLLDFFVSASRSILEKYLKIDIKTDALVNRCDLSQHIIGKMMEESGMFYVYPKETQQVIDEHVSGHSFLVCSIQNTYYLIDLTFRQFFIEEFCDLNRLQVKDDLVIQSPDPGFFIISDDFGISVANKILKDGYIKLDDDIAKVYGDAFYFTKRGKQIYEDISGEEYFNRLIEVNNTYAVDDERFYDMYGKIM